MTTKDEALQIAIEALPELISTAQAEYESQAKAYEGYPNMAYRYSYLKDIADDGTKALNACKEALEQPDWQILTDNEILAIDDVTLGDYYVESMANNFARAIEQALKEKNG